MPDKVGWLRIATGGVLGLAVGVLIAHLPWPWPAVILGVTILAMVIWLIREQRELGRMRRQLEDWERRLEDIERT